LLYSLFAIVILLGKALKALAWFFVIVRERIRFLLYFTNDYRHSNAVFVVLDRKHTENLY